MIFGIIIGAILLFILIGIVSKNHQDNSKEIMFSGYYIDSSYKDIFNSNFLMRMGIENDKVKLYINKNHEIKIQFIKLISYELQTESQIKQQITLGRLLVFGVFALGLKKQKEDIIKYAVLKYTNDNGKEENIIIKSKYISLFLEELHKKYNLYNSSVTVQG